MNTKGLERIIIIFSLLLIAISSINQAKAVIIFDVWGENFEDDTWVDNWDLAGYLRIPKGGVYYESVDSGFSVVNGVLTAPNTQGDQNASMALHDSNVAYGNWSFDWFVKEDYTPEYLPWDVIAFMMIDSKYNYNYTGMTEPEALMYSKGYYLEMNLYSNQLVSKIILGVIGIIEFPYYETIDSYQYVGSLTGSHHFDITRNLQGQFKVYHNSELILQATDNSSVTSEKFSFNSYNGESGIDNITINGFFTSTTTTTISTTSTTSTTSSNSSSTIATTPEATEGYIVWVLAQSLIILAVIRKKRKKE